MAYITVPVTGTGSTDDPRRPDTTHDQWAVIADDGDTMTIQIDDALADRVVAIEQALGVTPDTPDDLP